MLNLNLIQKKKNKKSTIYLSLYKSLIKLFIKRKNMKALWLYVFSERMYTGVNFKKKERKNTCCYWKAVYISEFDIVIWRQCTFMSLTFVILKAVYVYEFDIVTFHSLGAMIISECDHAYLPCIITGNFVCIYLFYLFYLLHHIISPFRQSSFSLTFFPLSFLVNAMFSNEMSSQKVVREPPFFFIK